MKEPKFHPLTKKELEKGHVTKPGWPRSSTNAYGTVGVVKDPDHIEGSTKHWYLKYTETGWQTGGFKTKQAAKDWYMNGGR